MDGRLRPRVKSYHDSWAFWPEVLWTWTLSLLLQHPQARKKNLHAYKVNLAPIAFMYVFWSLLPPDKYTTILHHYRIVLTQYKKFQPLKCSNDKSLHGSSEKYAVLPHIASSTLAACLQTLISSWRQKNQKQKSYDVTARAHQGFQHDSWSSKIIDIIIHQGRTAKEQQFCNRLPGPQTGTELSRDLS